MYVTRENHIKQIKPVSQRQILYDFSHMSFVDFI